MNLIYAALIAAALSAFGTWKVQDWRHAAIEKERIEAQRELERNRERVIDHAAVSHEKDKSGIRTEFVEIEREVERVVEKTIYANVCLDDDGLRVLARAISGASAPSQPAREVPRFNEPAERDWQSNARLVHSHGSGLPGVPEPARADGRGLAEVKD